jgi:putative nucleotidyltransferase with HDIG domain
MGDKLADENAYFHSLNVMLLSVLLGKTLDLSPEELKVLGEGALLHDIGATRVPDTVLRNPRRNRYEEEFYRLHTVYGAEIAREIGVLAPSAVEIIAAHHEYMDGSGYPAGLSGERIPRLARIVGIVNRYDNLCNPLQQMSAMTPAEALSVLFKSDVGRWDPVLLQKLVKVLGVYPPGSLVQLSNGNQGVVVTTNHANALRPTVLVFDPSVPRNEAVIVDLAEAVDVSVDTALRPADLEPAALAYLAPRRRLSYFHSTPGQSGSKG